jgi:hypothetical protein
MAKFIGVGTLFIGYVALALAGIYGWVMNIVHLVHHLQATGFQFDVEMAVRLLGIPVAIVGAIIGYF